MIQAADGQFMARAVQLARRGLFTTTPNPRVGAVLVRDGQVVGEGWHRHAGEPHAEVLALQAAGEKAQASTCYVTLEPCNHQGRTGPCAEALIAAGVSRVVFGHEDPDPRTAGAGIERLRQAGVVVEGPLLERECRQLNSGFVLRHGLGRPLVRVKMAMSLDGRTAMPSGDAFWITGPKARQDVHLWRARSCALVSGWKTLTQDQAQLNVRPESTEGPWRYWTGRQPLRVVLDSQLRLDRSERFFTTPGPWLVANTLRTEALEGGELVQLAAQNGRVDLRALLDYLAGRGINEILVEAGPELAGAFVRQGLVDELIIYLAPKLMGSLSKPLFELPLSHMGEALPLHIREVRSIGQDLRIIATAETD